MEKVIAAAALVLALGSFSVTSADAQGPTRLLQRNDVALSADVSAGTRQLHENVRVTAQSVSHGPEKLFSTSIIRVLAVPATVPGANSGHPLCAFARHGKVRLSDDAPRWT